MKKPSRFSDDKLPANIFDLKYFHKSKIDDRFLISKVLYRFENFNFHVGVDFLHKRQVSVTSILVRGQATHDKDPTCKEKFTTNVIWEGYRTFKKTKYKFTVYEKNGCLLEQYMHEIENLTTKTLNFILILLVELMIKIHKSKAYFKSVDFKTLQLVDDPNTKSAKILISSPSILQFKPESNKQTRSLFSQKDMNFPKTEDFYHRSRGLSFFLQKINGKPSCRRDIQIIYQKLSQIQSEYEMNMKYGQGQFKQQYFKQIKTFLLKVTKCLSNEQYTAQNIKKYKQIASSINAQIHEQKQKAKQIIEKIKTKNQLNLLLLCQQIQNTQNELKQPSCEEEEGNIDFQLSFNQQQQIGLEIGERISSHVLVTRLASQLNQQC